MPSRSRTIEDSPSVRGTTESASASSGTVLEPVVAQWVKRHRTEKIPRAEKRRLDEKRKAAVEQRDRHKLAKELKAENGCHSKLVACTASPASDGHDFQRRLLREAGRMMMEAVDLDRDCDDDPTIIGFCTIGDDLFGLRPRDRLRVIQERAAQLARDAKRDRVPPLVLVVYGYGLRGLHAHIFAVMKTSRLKRYRVSDGFLPFIRNNPAEGFKRATPFHLENYGLRNLEEPGPITGGRVRLSAELKRRLVDGGRVPPFSTPQLGFEPEPPAVVEPIVAALQPLWVDDAGQASMLPPSPCIAGTALRRLRLALGRTQAGLAASLGLSQPHLANVERGHDNLSALKACRVISLAHDELGQARVDAILTGECTA